MHSLFVNAAYIKILTEDLHMSGAAPYHYAKTIAFQQIDVIADAATLIAFGRGLYFESLGNEAQFHRDFGERGRRFPFWVAACIAIDPGFAVFLTEDEKIIGMAVLGADRREKTVGHVHHFFVTASHRGQGFGGLLDDYARATLRRAGFVRARLNVTTRNDRAIRFYLAQGWDDVGGGKPGLRFMEVAL